MFEQTFKTIDDVLWKEAGCTTELDYVEQTEAGLGAADAVAREREIAGVGEVGEEAGKLAHADDAAGPM